MQWNIKPLVGAGPLWLGMSESEVREILGSPKYTEIDQHTVSEYRELELPELLYENSKLVEISFTRHTKDTVFMDLLAFTYPLDII